MEVQFKKTMPKNQNIESIPSISGGLDAGMDRLQEAEAKYDELYVDCWAMVTAIRKMLINISKDSKKQILLALETFSEKHLNSHVEFDIVCSVSSTGGEAGHRQSAKVNNSNS